MNKDETMLFMKKLFAKHGISQAELARKLGTTRQYINSLSKGVRTITHEYMLRITDYYPMEEYTEKNNYIIIPFFDNFKEKYYLDRKLFNRKPFDIDINSLRVINIISDSMSPEYSLGDKAIIDTSVGQFIDSQIFVFRMGVNTYIRRVNIMPNQIKCVATNATHDTFYLQQADNYKIVGALVPKIRL